MNLMRMTEDDKTTKNISMKTFEILDYGFEKLPTENVDGKRYYVTPTGEKYPSVTSVTGLLNKESIKKWRKKVGEEKANKISTHLQDMVHLHTNYLKIIFVMITLKKSLSLQCLQHNLHSYQLQNFLIKSEQFMH